MAIFDPVLFDPVIFDAEPPVATSLSVPVRVVVATPHALTLPVQVAVVPAAVLAGSAPVCQPTGGQAAVWVAVVSVDGIDRAGQVLGEIVIEAEEDAARIADFTLRPPPGTPLDLAGWTGLPVTIDVADWRTGSARYAMRLFTGVVDLPQVDIASGTVSLRCTDDLQGQVAALSNAQILALIGGRESAAVFDPAARGWAFAQDRLSTVAASLDLSPYGVPRLTDWAPKVTPDLSYDETAILDGSLRVEIADRASLVNTVEVAFDYRFPRVKADAYAVAYEFVNMTNFAAFVSAGGFFLQRAAVEAALSAAGASLVVPVAYEPLPTTSVPVGAGFWTPGPADGELCMGFTATVSFDFSQEITEQHRITVQAVKSVAAVGVRRKTIRGALQGEYPDLTAAETAAILYKADITSIPPTDTATPAAGMVTEADVTLAPGTDRDAADAAMEALIDVAKVDIHRAHRGNSVGGAVPCNPAIDLDKTLAIAAGGVTARGKVRRLVHRLDPDAGTAVTEFALALCSIAGYGITHDEDATAAPAGTSPTSTPVPGSPLVVYNSGATEDHVITITFPGVEEAERAAAERLLPSTVAAPLTEDLFTVSF